MIHTTVKGVALLLACGTGLAMLGGCSSASPDGSTSSNGSTTSASPTKGTPSSSGSAKTTSASGASSASTATGECTDVSILAALPAGSTMVKYACALASPTMWAAARVNPGPAVFFLQNTGRAWKVSTAKQICGKPPAGLPMEIKAFCPKT